MVEKRWAGLAVWREIWAGSAGVAGRCMESEYFGGPTVGRQSIQLICSYRKLVSEVSFATDSHDPDRRREHLMTAAVYSSMLCSPARCLGTQVRPHIARREVLDLTCCGVK